MNLTVVKCKKCIKLVKFKSLKEAFSVVVLSHLDPLYLGYISI